jgi:hypothetical protein
VFFTPFREGPSRETFEEKIWRKGLIFCLRMIKLDFIFLSDFQDGSTSFHEDLTKEFEYSTLSLSPLKSEGDGGGNDLK